MSRNLCTRDPWISYSTGGNTRSRGGPHPQWGAIWSYPKFETSSLSIGFVQLSNWASTCWIPILSSPLEVQWYWGVIRCYINTDHEALRWYLRSHDPIPSYPTRIVFPRLVSVRRTFFSAASASRACCALCSRAYDVLDSVLPQSVPWFKPGVHVGSWHMGVAYVIIWHVTWLRGGVLNERFWRWKTWGKLIWLLWRWGVRMFVQGFHTLIDHGQVNVLCHPALLQVR